ncbi:hypothetical protein INT48_004998 [Thamnidium elegans]|uniref:Cas12f1-like TNB domain-containing protein n=1 Tax=Thamnidium elegans TaxID=101142 RepID=A0A8H7SR84_9FUNG|nr:hypothetical protein INT48_004998 [Thamnidium elegans]
MPLMIFGDSMKGKSHVKHKGHRVGVLKIIYRQLKRKEKLGEVFVLDINEFRTSSVCHNCNKKNLRHHKVEDRTLFGRFIYNNCNIYWNCDVLAAQNIMLRRSGLGLDDQKYLLVKIHKARHRRWLSLQHV